MFSCLEGYTPLRAGRRYYGRSGGVLVAGPGRGASARPAEHLPETIEIDISDLRIGDSFRISDLSIELLSITIISYLIFLLV